MGKERVWLYLLYLDQTLTANSVTGTGPCNAPHGSTVRHAAADPARVLARGQPVILASQMLLGVNSLQIHTHTADTIRLGLGNEGCDKREEEIILLNKMHSHCG